MTLEERIKGLCSAVRLELIDEDKACEGILTAVAESVPSKAVSVDETNLDRDLTEYDQGWNDAIDQVLAQLGKEEK